MKHRKQNQHHWIFALIHTMMVLLGVSALVFFMSQFVKGDIAETIVLQRGLEPTVVEIELVKAELGLNDPLLTQYLRWVSHALRGDLGTSYRSGKPVMTELMTRFETTLRLSSITAVVVIVLTLGLGIGCVLDPHGVIRTVCSLLVIIGSSIPTFVLALGMITLFALVLGWVNVIHSHSWTSMVLPVLTLALAVLPSSLRIFQTSLDLQMNQLYVTVLKSRGFSLRHIVFNDVLKVALAPVLTQFSLTLGQLLGGSVIIETIYGIGGIGQFIIVSIFNRDYPIISGYVLIMGVVFVLLHHGVELMSRWLYPFYYAQERKQP